MTRTRPLAYALSLSVGVAGVTLAIHYFMSPGYAALFLGVFCLVFAYHVGDSEDDEPVGATVSETPEEDPRDG